MLIYGMYNIYGTTL